MIVTFMMLSRPGRILPNKPIVARNALDEDKGGKVSDAREHRTVAAKEKVRHPKEIESTAIIE